FPEPSSSAKPPRGGGGGGGTWVLLDGVDCEGLCWNLAARRLGEQPHAGSHSAGQFSSSFGSFAQPCTQWLHKADYKLQRIPEGAKSDAGAREPREPLIPVTEWDKLGKAWTTQIQAHQAAESLPWEPGVIIRPIQRGPGTLGARRPARAGAPVPGSPWGRTTHREEYSSRKDEGGLFLDPFLLSYQRGRLRAC
uniref:Uncharacterized protein n=1 Tax=Panthera tigris altaica TaxID=74533 RepID=A0A8C9MD14_PANTA